MQDSRTAYVILGMLSVEPNRSGYDIRKAIEGSVGHFWRESYGQIYPTLKRLAAEGLIAPDRATSGSSRQRQQYSLTAAGHAALRDWLALPFQNDPPRNEFLLKLFFGREAGPGISIAHVKELQERNRRTLEMLTEIRALSEKHNADNPHWPYWMLTLGLGRALTEAALQWGEKALLALAALETAPKKTAAKRTTRKRSAR